MFSMVRFGGWLKLVSTGASLAKLSGGQTLAICGHIGPAPFHGYTCVALSESCGLAIHCQIVCCSSPVRVVFEKRFHLPLKVSITSATGLIHLSLRSFST